MAHLDVVKFYREVNRPAIPENEFSGRIAASAENIQRLKSSLDPHRVESAAQGSEDLVDQMELLQTNGAPIDIRIRLGSRAVDKWYKNAINLLLSCASLKKGVFPTSFYLIDEDICYPEESHPIIDELKKFCEFINVLLKLAHYHDTKNSNTEITTVVFVASISEISKPLLLDIHTSQEMIECVPQDFSFMSYLISDEAKLDPHYHEKLHVFSSTLLEFINPDEVPTDAFSKLVRSWDKFVEIYQNNLSTYLSGFTFHKAKREVAQAEIDIANQLSNIISDITNKILTVPVSLAAIIPLFNYNFNFFECAILILGLLITSIIISGSIDNQKSRLDSIEESKILVLQSIDGKKEQYPKELSISIEKMKDRLRKCFSNSRKWLMCYRILSWTPVVVAMIVFLFFRNR